jgi:hypothetical protein
MVDWDRVRERRSRGDGWEEIASDPKVGFHPEASAGDPGRALRALYHREEARHARQGPAPTPKRRPARELEQRWTLVRLGYLLVAVVGIWALLAYLAPSPVGLLLPAIPYLALALLGVAFLLLYALWRTRDRRWSEVLRGTVVGGVVLGLVVAGMISLVGVLVFGCPYLPPASAVTSTANATGWHGPGGLPAWTEGGKPVVYFYGATWCPYCSASSWAIWKALTEFGTITGERTGYSSASDIDPQTPEMILADVQLTSNHSAFQVSEYTGSTDGVAPGESNCYQLAYVTAYSGGTIPFLEVGGKYVHGGVTLVNPDLLKPYEGTGKAVVRADVENQTGAPWHDVANQTFWIMAFIAKCCGMNPGSFPGTWKTGMRTAVAYDLGEL